MVVAVLFLVLLLTPMKVSAASSMAVLQNQTSPPASRQRNLDISLFGKRIQFDFKVGTLGLIMVIVLAALFSTALLLALFARRRAKQAQIANQQLREEITERKRAEKALLESEERLQLAIESTKLGIWEFKPKTGELHWSGQCRAIFGFPPNANVNTESVSERIHPEDRKRLDEILQRACQPDSGGDLHVQYRILVSTDQVERWIESRGLTIFEKGQAVRLTGTMLDITKRKGVEEALRESEERLRLGLQAAHLGTWDYRFDTGDVFWDERGYRNFGLSSAKTTYDATIDRIHPEDRGGVSVKVQEALGGKNDGAYEQEFRVIWPDGSVHWLAAYGRVYFKGEGESRLALRYIGLNMDITERKQAEETQNRSELRYRRLFESAKDGILILDAESGQIIDVNPFLIEILGFSKEELTGKELWEIGAFQDIVASKLAFDELQQRGYIRYEDLPLKTREGLTRQVEFVSNSYLADETRVIQCNIRDITERKLAEEELRQTNKRLEEALAQLLTQTQELASMTQQLWQASKLATMGELAASVAHELNNPLATLALRAEFLLERLSDDDPKRRAVEVIEQEVDRMATLVSNLLLFSRRGQPQISTIKVVEELHNSLEFINYHLRSRSITVATEFADNLPSVQADTQQLRQVFLNLLTNAGDAMTEGGTLTVRARRGVLGNNTMALVIEFSDTGTGIEPDVLPKLWEPFFTTKSEGKGTGLGLPICRRTVEEHRGTIDIESVPGKGTTVRILLPAMEAKATKA